MTVFCDMEAITSPQPAPAPRTKSIKGPSTLMATSGISQRRRSSALTDQKSPSYRNNFNEQNSGMEGIVLNTMLNPLVSKLMSKGAELYLPENMVKTILRAFIILNFLGFLSRRANAC
jgi:hypothetical protein